MRLLERQPDGDLVLREFADNDVATYAILSHTWLADNNDEVSFQDVEGGSGKSKAGWEKITFCASAAAAHGLRYFWIDTCCIDKENKAELSQATRSMYRWYRNATRCYVYLSDVHSRKRKRGDEDAHNTWEQAFQKSRWFTRGWTLRHGKRQLELNFLPLAVLYNFLTLLSLQIDEQTSKNAKTFWIRLPRDPG